MRFRHKPTEVTAREFSGTVPSAQELILWFHDQDVENQELTFGVSPVLEGEAWLDLQSENMTDVAVKGDFLVIGLDRKAYVCPAHVFREAYEPLV